MTIKQGAAVWAATGAMLLTWVAFAAGVNSGTDNEVKDEIAQVEKIERFYRIVAGDVSGSEPGPANRLARDLRDVASEALTSFTGDSNRYGGITEDLGFDPFNGIDCSECGPLDREVIEDTQAIKAGDLDEVIERLESGVPDPNELPGPPGFLWFVWFLSFPTVAGITYLQRRRSEEDRYRDFPEERRLLENLREAKNELPPGNSQWVALDQLEDRLREQIEVRINYKESKTQAIKLEALTQEASSALEDVAAGNEALD